MLRVRRFSSITSSTSASRQIRRASVTGVPLFFPGITAEVIAVRLPKTRSVRLHEAKTAHPLCRLPEVEARNQEARGTAVLGCQRRAVVLVRDDCLVAAEIGDLQVGGV